MASSNIARLGVVMGLDTAVLTADINKAIEQFKGLKSQIKRESDAAAKEIANLKFATEDYGKEVSKVTQVERELTSGRLRNATPELQNILRQQAKAYDDVVAAAKKYAQEQAVDQHISELKFVTDTYGQSLTKVQQVERDIVKFNLVDQAKIDALRQQAAAYDRVAESAKRAQATESLVRDIQALKFATDDYGRSLTKLEQVNRDIAGGKYQLADQAKIASLRQQAKAYDDVVAASKKYAQEQNINQHIAELKFATDTYGQSLTKVQQIERDIAKFNLVDQSKIDSLRQQAAAYDRVADAARKAKAEEGITKQISDLKFATENYGKALTRVQLIEHDISTGKYRDVSPQLVQQLLAQAKAYDQVTAAGKRATGMLSEQQKMAITYQTTDFVTQIASGQNAMIALLQQGGQLKDQFGGVGNMFRALGSYITGTAVAIGSVVTAIGAYVFAVNSAQKEQSKFNNDLSLTGGYANVTYRQMLALSSAIGNDLKISVGEAKDIYSQLIASGKITGSAMDSVARAIANVARFSGGSAKEVSQKLIPAFLGGASSIKELNDRYNFLNIEQYKNIVLLDKQGKYQDAAKIAADAFNKKLKDQEAQFGYLEKMMHSVKMAASSMWDAILNIGRQDTGIDRAKILEQEINKQTALMMQMEENRPGSAMAAGKRRDIERLRKELNDIFEKENKRLAGLEGSSADKQKIGDEAKNGEKRRQLNFDIQQEIIKNRYDSLRLGVDEERRIELDAAEKIEIAKLELAKKNQQEGGVFAKQNADKLAADLVKIENDKQAQLLQMAQKRVQLVFDIEKQQDKNRFAVLRENANEQELIEIDAQEKINSARRDMFQKNLSENFLFATKNAQLLADQEVGIEQEKQARIKKLVRDRYISEYNAMAEYLQGIQDEMNAENARKGEVYRNVVDTIAEEKKGLEYEKQKVQLQQRMIGASDKELALAMLELDTQRRISEVKENRDLTDSDKRMAENAIKRNQDLKSSFIVMEDSLKKMQLNYNAVFGNLESAIDKFAQTGKFSFKDFANSVIRDLALIQLKAAATSIFKTILNGIGLFTGGATGGGEITGGSGLTPRASGGTVSPSTAYMVGERGPELFVPRSSGTIIPNGAMAGMSQPQVINNYNIQAIDVKSFEDRIFGSSNAIWAANAYASKSMAIGRGRT